MVTARVERRDGTRIAGKITDDDLAGRDFVMRYSVPYFGEVERRPISVNPEADGLYFVDHGTPMRFGPSSAAYYQDGEWLRTNKRPWKMRPTHWSKVPGLPVRPPASE